MCDWASLASPVSVSDAVFLDRDTSPATRWVKPGQRHFRGGLCARPYTVFTTKLSTASRVLQRSELT